MADQEETKDASAAEAEILKREVPLAYYGTEDIVGVFADQAMVSHATGLFTLLFFQTQVPPTTDLEVLQKIETIPARCVAKIILTPQLIEQLFTAMEGNIQKYKVRVAALENSKE